MTSTDRERVKAILHYENYDRIPLVHFGCWDELYGIWLEQGKMTRADYDDYRSGRRDMFRELGFDFEWGAQIGVCGLLVPGFEYKELERDAEGNVTYINGNGLIEQRRDGAISIPKTIGTLLDGREAWESLYKPKLTPGEHRYDRAGYRAFAEGFNKTSDKPVGIHAGSFYGSIRDMLGVEALSYLSADDEELYAELIEMVGTLNYNGVKAMLDEGVRPDFAHMWEDICFKNGPLVNPAMFDKYVGPQYKRITDLLKEYGCDIVSLDCDGCIDKLVPIWLENGVNTMFPIEVGTWEASIEPWREKYGSKLRGVGGMNKLVLALDYAAIDREIERLRRLADLGGYIPCPDHRLPPETKWENVQYYCDRYKKVFGW
jgi:Uroporphyrinogen-III decarboxylase